MSPERDNISRKERFSQILLQTLHILTSESVLTNCRHNVALVSRERQFIFLLPVCVGLQQLEPNTVVSSDFGLLVSNRLFAGFLIVLRSWLETLTWRFTTGYDLTLQPKAFIVVLFQRTNENMQSTTADVKLIWYVSRLMTDWTVNMPSEIKSVWSSTCSAVRSMCSAARSEKPLHVHDIQTWQQYYASN